MERLRFKTKEEFLEEFGGRWRGCNSQGWVEGMDFMLGKEILDNSTIKSLLNQDIVRGYRHPGKHSHWAIGPEMVTEMVEKPYRVMQGVGLI